MKLVGPPEHLGPPLPTVSLVTAASGLQDKGPPGNPRTSSAPFCTPALPSGRLSLHRLTGGQGAKRSGTCTELRRLSDIGPERQERSVGGKYASGGNSLCQDPKFEGAS